MKEKKPVKAPKKRLGAVEYVLLAVIVLAIAGSVWMLVDSSQKKQQNTPFERTGYAMGSLVQQTVYPNTDSSSDAAAAVNSEIAALENDISWRIEGSDVERINKYAGKAGVHIEDRTASLLETALLVAEKSGGAYSPTLLPLSLLWNFDDPDASFSPPEQELVESLLPFVDYHSLSVNSAAGTAFLEQESAAVDLGGIGKGAACDVALQIYQEKGVQGAVVAVGGSVGVYGTRPDGENWVVGVRDPAGDQAAVLGVLTMESGCVSTSGIYEKGAQVDGVYYHHIVDSRTGYPADSGLLSATVLHPSGAISDALATACVVLGKDGALELLNAYGAQGILVDTNKTIYLTDGLKDRFSLSNTDYRLAE